MVTPLRLLACLCVLAPGPVRGVQIVGYDPAVHDRFSAGYAALTTPVPNNGAGFIGAGFDWSGVVWNTANRKQSFALVSRKHALYAKHFPAGSAVGYFGAQSGLGSAVVGAKVGFGDSDIGVATLGRVLPAGVAVYPLLDLPTSGSYVGRNLLMYGWYGRIGRSVVAGVYPNGDPNTGLPDKYIFNYEAPAGRADFVTLESNDSGSPAFIGFGGELTLTGSHYYIFGTPPGGGGDSFFALPGAVGQINAVLAADGFALRFRSEPARAWSGLASGNMGSGLNWTPFGGAPSSSQTVGFSGSSSTKSVSLSADQSVRGIVFTGAVGETGFAITAGNTLRLGYVGLRNEAPAAQSLGVAVALEAAQHWTAASGDLDVAGAVGLGGYFLNLGGEHTIQLGGPISGSGGLAVQEGFTRLSGTASFTGPTFLYGGTLEVAAGGQLPAAARLVMGGGTLRLLAPVVNLGALRLVDDSRLELPATGMDLRIAASSGEAWEAGKRLTITGFNPALHSVRIGTDFSASSAEQWAAVRFDEIPAFPSGEGVLRPASALQRWQLAEFPTEAGNPATREALWGPNADPRGAGMSNLLRYALGLALTATPADLPVPVRSADGVLTFTIARNPEASGVGFVVEVSSDLADWRSGAEHVEVTTDEAALLVVRDRNPAGGTRRFMRLRVVSTQG
jgi:hypothetical protein